jgi:hypothetical protein
MEEVAMRRWAAWSLGVAVVVGGCGDSTGPGESGTFEAHVRGEVSADVVGRAQFGSHRGEGFGLVMSPEDASHWIGIGNRNEGRPAVGTYPLTRPTSDAQFYAAYMHQSAAGLVGFTSISGEMVITTSTESLLEGTFVFTARGTLTGDPENQREVIVEGTFAARCDRSARCN